MMFGVFSYILPSSANHQSITMKCEHFVALTYLQSGMSTDWISGRGSTKLDMADIQNLFQATMLYRDRGGGICPNWGWGRGDVSYDSGLTVFLHYFEHYSTILCLFSTKADRPLTSVVSNHFVFAYPSATASFSQFLQVRKDFYKVQAEQ